MWTTKNGKKKEVKGLSDSHIRNIIRYFGRGVISCELENSFDEVLGEAEQRGIRYDPERIIHESDIYYPDFLQGF